MSPVGHDPMYFGQGTGMYYDHMRSGPYEGKTLTNKWGSLTNLDPRGGWSQNSFNASSPLGGVPPPNWGGAKAPPDPAPGGQGPPDPPYAQARMARTAREHEVIMARDMVNSR